MKNKKLLLKSMMVLSLIFAISCKSNSNPDDTTTQTPSANQKTPVAIDIAETSKAAKTTTLKMLLNKTQNEVKTPADLIFTGADADATLEVSGFGLVSDDPKNTTTAAGKTWQALASGDLAKSDIKLVKSGNKYTVAIDNGKVSAIKGKLSTDKYTVIGIQVTATKEGKEDKDLTFYVVVLQEA